VWTDESYDTVALRDGLPLTGTVESLVGDQLQLTTGEGNTRSIGKDDVSFILFDTTRTYKMPDPPADYDGSRDLVFLRDKGGVKTGTVTAITRSDVIADVGVFKRDMVIQVLFGTPRTTPGAQPPGHAGESTPLPSPATTQPPTPPGGTPQPQATNSDESLANACPVDKPLGGWIQEESIIQPPTIPCLVTLRRFSWFHLAPPAGESWTDALGKWFTASQVSYKWTFDGAANTKGWTCQGAADQISGEAHLGSSDEGHLEFVPLAPSLVFQLQDAVELDVPITFKNLPTGLGGQETTDTIPFVAQGQDTQIIVDQPGCGNPPQIGCVGPTLCWAGQYPSVAKDCIANPERYAVIPFAGGTARELSSDEADAHDGLKYEAVKWAVCCGCGEGAPTVPGQAQTPGPQSGGPTPTPDLCPAPLEAQSQIATLALRRQQIVDEIKSQWSQFQDYRNEAQDNVEAYRAAIGFCAIEEIGQEMLTFEVGENGGKAGAATTKIIGIAQKLMDGDWSILLPKNEEPGEEYDVEQAWDVIRNILSGAGAGSPEGMREKLEECDLLPADLRAGALKFVDSTQAYLEMMPALRTLVNDVRQLDIVSYDWQLKYYPQCVQYQECKGLDPSTCPLPPEGSGVLH
jgi:hypothetical protein